MSLARRGFLRLLGAAPVALPGVAREAATKAGIGQAFAPEIGFGSPQGYPANPASEGEWITSICERVFSKEWEKEERERRKNWHVSNLDPDLASSRSLSLSAAMIIQRQRNIDRSIASEREEAKRNYLRFFKVDFLGITEGAA